MYRDPLPKRQPTQWPPCKCGKPECPEVRKRERLGSVSAPLRARLLEAVNRWRDDL